MRFTGITFMMMGPMNTDKREYRTLKNELERLDPGPGLERDMEQLLSRDENRSSFRRRPGPAFRDRVGRGFRNLVAILICVILVGLWFYDWNLSAFTNRTSDIFSSVFSDEPEQPFEFQFNSPPPPPSVPSIPEISELPGDIEADIEAEITGGIRELNMGMTDYVSAFEEAGYRDRFSMGEISGFFHTGMPVSYLDALNEAGFLDQLSYPAILTYFSSGITTEYLTQLQEGGYLDRFDFPAVTAFYSSGITKGYLDELGEKGLLDTLSFQDIIIMYQSEYGG